VSDKSHQGQEPPATADAEIEHSDAPAEIEIHSVEPIDWREDAVEVKVTGDHFTDGLAVNAGEQALTPEVISPNELRIEIPKHVIGDDSQIEIHFPGGWMRQADLRLSEFLRHEGESPLSYEGGLAGDGDTDY